MKTHKIVILSLNVDGDTQTNLDETANAATGLQVKYGPGANRALMPGLLPVTAKVEQGAAQGDYSEVIKMEVEERDKVTKFCNGTESIGMYILVHATKNYAGTAATKVTGSTIGAFVKGLGITLTHICVVACDLGSGSHLLDICKSFTEVASDVTGSVDHPQPPKVAGYNLPVFIDKETGGKKVQLAVENVNGRNVFPKTFTTKSISEAELDPEANKRLQKSQMAMVAAKKTYKSLYVYANGSWSNTWMGKHT